MNLTLLLRRVFAYVLDITLLFVVLAPVAFLVRAVLDVDPGSGVQVWMAAVLSFSVPVWLYFTLSDASRRGATVGKRVLGLAVTALHGADGVPFGPALVRTAVKLLPWELAHVFGFALADIVSESVQMWGLVLANVLALVYLAVAIATGGRRSVHDYPAGTEVVRRPAAESGP